MDGITALSELLLNLCLSALFQTALFSRPRGLWASRCPSRGGAGERGAIPPPWDHHDVQCYCKIRASLPRCTEEVCEYPFITQILIYFTYCIAKGDGQCISPDPENCNYLLCLVNINSPAFGVSMFSWGCVRLCVCSPRKGAALQAAEVRTIITDYVKKNELVDDNNKK